MRVTDDFMQAVLDDSDWHLRAVTTGEVVRTVKARDLFRQLAKAAWECADPGLQYDTTLNRWHTASNTGRSHSVGLRADGTVLAVGWNDDGQCDVGSWRGVTIVAAGWRRTLGLVGDGTVLAAGRLREGAGDVGLGHRGEGADAAGVFAALQQGGAVQGHTLYGTYPTLVLGGPDDTDSGSNPRGRWIPTTSVEQYAATLALWYGLSSADLSIVFPLIDRFPTANLGFLA